MEGHMMATIWPDYRSDEGRDILAETMDEIAMYEAETERIRLNYEATGWKSDGWSEPLRARRIRDKQRMKARVRRIAISCWDVRASSWASEADRQEWLKASEHLADNLAYCSRYCCNKRRLHEGPPMQEVRAADAAELGVIEWLNDWA
jgi:hypothetical protein